MITSDDSHAQQTREGALPAASTAPPMQRIGLVAARSKEEAQELAEHVDAYLVSQGATVVHEDELLRTRAADVDAIIVLGGDGLMIRTANVYPGVPLLGINFGNVGFLALFERRDWQQAVSSLLNGQFTIQEGPTLKSTLVKGEDIQPMGTAINDVVVRAGSRMIDLEIYIDGQYVNTYPGDGMIVATPHGSTAYGMAAGGPILTAGVRGFALVPISCHSPIRTPLVVPESSVIEIVMTNDHESSLILDGSEIRRLRRWDNVRVESGDASFRLVTLGSTNFYEAFRTKFNFKIRPDAVPSRGQNGASPGAVRDPST